MATANSLATWGGLMTNFLPGFVELHKRGTNVYKIAFGKQKWEGKKLVKFINTRWNTAVYNASDGAGIPPPKPTVFAETECYRKFQTMGVLITDGLMAAAGTDQKSCVAAVKGIVRNALDMSTRYTNYFMARDGTGVAALLGTTTSGAFIDVTDARIFLPGALFEIRASTAHDGYAIGDVIASFEVSYVNRARTAANESRVYTVAAVPNNNQIAGDYVVWGQGAYTSWGKAITGLGALIDDTATTSFQGVNTITNPYFTSPVIDNGGAAWNLTLNSVRRMLAMLKQESEDFSDPGGLLVMGEGWNAVQIEGMWDGAVRLTPDSKAAGFAGGLTLKTALGTITIASDHSFPYGELHFINRSAISYPVQQERHWRTSEGGSIFTPAPNALGHYATMVEIGDLFILERQTCGKMTNITVIPGSAY